MDFRPAERLGTPVRIRAVLPPLGPDPAPSGRRAPAARETGPGERPPLPAFRIGARSASGDRHRPASPAPSSRAAAASARLPQGRGRLLRGGTAAPAGRRPR